MADSSKLDKTFDPTAIETRLYEAWENEGCFKAGRVPEAEPYTIVIPPPNVTGSLHMGYALNNTLQDILCRFERMRGRDVLWQPGTFIPALRRKWWLSGNWLSRAMKAAAKWAARNFERVWQWKEESGSTITRQLPARRKCDWSRERFTMDEGCPKPCSRFS